MRVQYNIGVRWTGTGGSGAQEHTEEYTVYATLPVSRSMFESRHDLRVFLKNLADEFPFMHYQNTKIERMSAKILDNRPHAEARIEAKGIGKYRIPGVEEAMQYRTTVEIRKYKEQKQLQHAIERELSNTVQALRSLRETLQNAAFNLVVYPVAFAQAVFQNKQQHSQQQQNKQQHSQQQQNTRLKPYPRMRIWEEEDRERER